MLRALIADVDGTLYRQAPVRRYVAEQLLKHLVRQPVSGWKTWRALRAYRRAQEQLRPSQAPGAAHLQTAYAARHTGYEEIFVRDCVRRWMEIAPLPALLPARYLDLEPFCRWATEKGLRLGVLSDYDPCEKLHALELDRYFAVAVCAQDEEVGVFKPNPRGLHVALRRLGVDLGEAVYVGDRPEVDGAMATVSGVAGIMISSGEIDCPPGVARARDWSEVRKLIEGRVSHQ